jgi:hypothetical protein
MDIAPLVIPFLLLLTFGEVSGSGIPSRPSARTRVNIQKRRGEFDEEPKRSPEYRKYQRNLLLQRHASDREECIRRQALMRQHDLYVKAHEKYLEAKAEVLQALPGTPERERWSTVERELMAACDQLRVQNRDLEIVRPAAPSRTSWKAELVAKKSGEFRGNGLRFATSAEAGAHVLDLALRKTAVYNSRIVECGEPFNAKWTENGAVRL